VFNQATSRSDLTSRIDLTIAGLICLAPKNFFAEGPLRFYNGIIKFDLGQITVQNVAPISSRRSLEISRWNKKKSAVKHKFGRKYLL